MWVIKHNAVNEKKQQDLTAHMSSSPILVMGITSDRLSSTIRASSLVSPVDSCQFDGICFSTASIWNSGLLLLLLLYLTKQFDVCCFLLLALKWMAQLSSVLLLTWRESHMVGIQIYSMQSHHTAHVWVFFCSPIIPTAHWGHILSWVFIPLQCWWHPLIPFSSTCIKITFMHA